jgi:hypothetical protein
LVWVGYPATQAGESIGLGLFLATLAAFCCSGVLALRASVEELYDTLWMICVLGGVVLAIYWMAYWVIVPVSGGPLLRTSVSIVLGLWAVGIVSLVSYAPRALRYDPEPPII